MVLGSAVVAFNQICPHRFDLLHPHYRKLCRILADVDEWGQIVLLGTLLRYARTQFVKPVPGSSSRVRSFSSYAGDSSTSFSSSSGGSKYSSSNFSSSGLPAFGSGSSGHSSKGQRMAAAVTKVRCRLPVFALSVTLCRPNEGGAITICCLPRPVSGKLRRLLFRW